MDTTKRYVIRAEQKKLAAQSGSGTEYWYFPIYILDRQDGPEETIFTLQTDDGRRRTIAVASSDAASISTLTSTGRQSEIGALAPPPPIGGQRSAATATIWQAQSRYVPQSVNRAGTVAKTVEVMSWIFLGLSVIVGIIMAAATEESYYGDSSHPYIGLGITVAVAGTFQCLLVIMVASYIRARLELATIT